MSELLKHFLNQLSPTGFASLGAYLVSKVLASQTIRDTTGVFRLGCYVFLWSLFIFFVLGLFGLWIYPILGIAGTGGALWIFLVIRGIDENVREHGVTGFHLFMMGLVGGWAIWPFTEPPLVFVLGIGWYFFVACLGLVLWWRGLLGHKVPKVIEDYTDEIRTNPECANAWLDRGIAYREMFEYDKAIEDCTKAINLDLNLASAYHNRGLAYQKHRRLRKRKKATADFVKADKLRAFERAAAEEKQSALSPEAQRTYQESLLTRFQTTQSRDDLRVYVRAMNNTARLQCPKCGAEVKRKNLVTHYYRVHG